MKPTPKEPRAYHTPQVMDYGNVKQITMTFGKTGGTDGGSGVNKKTRA